MEKINDINNKIVLFDGIMNSLFNICDNIIKEYLTNKEILSIVMKDLGLNFHANGGIQIISKNYDKFKKGYSIIDVIETKDQHFLGLFDKLLRENRFILYQAIEDDSWIRNEPIKLMYGDTIGKTTDFIIHLSDIYKISLAIKSKHEKDIKEYPDFFKPDDKVKNPAKLLLNCFKAFKLTNSGQDSEKMKNINIIIGKIENKLGLGNSMNTINNIMSNIDPVLSIGADLLNKNRGGNGPEIKADNLKNILNEVFSTSSMNGIKSEIENNMRGDKPPDFGNILLSVFSNMKDNNIMDNFQNIVKKEIPGIMDEKKVENKNEENDKKSNNETVEEIIEEVEEEVEEEIIEEQ